MCRLSLSGVCSACHAGTMLHLRVLGKGESWDVAGWNRGWKLKAGAVSAGCLTGKCDVRNCSEPKMDGGMQSGGKQITEATEESCMEQKLGSKTCSLSALIAELFVVSTPLLLYTSLISYVTLFHIQITVYSTLYGFICIKSVILNLKHAKKIL